MKFVSERTSDESRRPLIIIDRFLIMPPPHSVFTVSLKPTAKITRKPETPKLILTSTTLKPLTHKIPTTELVPLKSTQPTLSTLSEAKTYKTHTIFRFYTKKFTIKERKLKTTKKPIKKVDHKILKFKDRALGKAKTRGEIFRQREEVRVDTTTLVTSNASGTLNKTTKLPKTLPPDLHALKIFSVVSMVVSLVAATIMLCVCIFVCNFRDTCKVDKTLKRQCDMMTPEEAAQIKECRAFRS